MTYIPSNVISFNIDKDQLRSYIGDIDNAILIQSSQIEPVTLIGTAERLYSISFTGIILCDRADAQKVVYVKDGELYFARSSLKDERLGETLCRIGKLTIEGLEKASKEITATRRLGKVLVESKYITPKDLWIGVRRQIFEIWGSYILPQDGWFHVIQTNIDSGNMIKPDTNMVDNLFQYIREVHDQLNVNLLYDSVIYLNSINSFSKPTDIEKVILKQMMVSNSIAVDSLAEKTDLKVPLLIEALIPLVYTGKLGIKKPVLKTESKTETQKFNELINLTNTIMTSIAEIMQQKAPDVNFKISVAEYVRSSGGMFKDCKLNEKGCFNTEVILKVYKASQNLSPYEDAVHFIKELIHFELFEMKNYLSKEQTTELENIISTLA
ncbi:MAG: hypothetical protein M1381_02385 [Deltaproteobacteria bacterium]|nr:hypothetical protein [Deltaproteobacteria bacterium]MCL5791874.1 hypothetical protein [Deltaproteobacteria bacterium]